MAKKKIDNINEEEAVNSSLNQNGETVVKETKKGRTKKAEPESKQPEVSETVNEVVSEETPIVEENQATEQQQEVSSEQSEEIIYEEQEPTTENLVDDSAEESSKPQNIDIDQLPDKVRKKYLPKTGSHGETLPPELSQPDNITKEDIENAVSDISNNKDQDSEFEISEEELEGLSEAEIEELKKSKKKYRELKLKYNPGKNKRSASGEYKKHLDFTSNTSIKRFKVKPPKKPFIIAGISFAGVLLIVGVILLVVFTRPAPPVVLSSIKLSQESTNQYVGEQVDLRGIYIECTYSDGSTGRVLASNNMLSSKSSNINSDYYIVSDNENTYVYLKYNGKEAKLSINTTEITASSITATIGQSQYLNTQTIDFDHILILLNTSIGDKRIDAKTATFKFADDSAVNKTSDGLSIETAGDYTIKVSCSYKGTTFETTFNVKIVEDTTVSA